MNSGFRANQLLNDHLIRKLVVISYSMTKYKILFFNIQTYSCINYTNPRNQFISFVTQGQKYKMTSSLRLNSDLIYTIQPYTVSLLKHAPTVMF
jgi:hypothetical protein